ncbi:hypothetical protein DPMN_173798 [Dreissena polymorpha]|uniref:Uncharacterized protein n=1 Tax=Dreissena polymorpha TaxID=45954 RepID=A0A9D4IFV0_DREPO|nr:hypothetical protein DPMN_173798 [Dreissena polymorpha]
MLRVYQVQDPQPYSLVHIGLNLSTAIILAIVSSLVWITDFLLNLLFTLDVDLKIDDSSCTLTMAHGS